MLKLFVLAYLADEGIKKACGTLQPGPPCPHGTQESHLVLLVKRALRPGPGFPDLSPAPIITADPHLRPRCDSAVTVQAGAVRSAARHQQLDN